MARTPRPNEKLDRAPLGVANVRDRGGGGLTLTPQAFEAVRRGHPWVWRSGIVEGLDRLSAGDAVCLRVTGPPGHSERDASEGSTPPLVALADPSSPIAARVLGPAEDGSPRSARDLLPLFERRLDRAVAIRRALFADGATDAYRLVHGEGDRLPGLVVDLYGDTAVVRFDGGHLGPHHAALLEALRGRIDAPNILVRSGGHGEERELVAAFGELPEAPVRVKEHGVPFEVDLVRGQKTGAFLDQRENRRRVGLMAASKRVLNLFSYAGGFSLHAAAAGATHVTSVDIASGGHATAERSFRAAGIDPKRHAFVLADAFAFLESAVRRGERWDLVVSDPPSFAPNEKAVGRAVAAYKKLHRACASVLSPSGVFAAASCSSHVSEALFMTTLDDAALGRSDLRVTATYGPPPDHPTLPAFPEGRYLKFVVLT